MEPGLPTDMEGGVAEEPAAEPGAPLEGGAGGGGRNLVQRLSELSGGLSPPGQQWSPDNSSDEEEVPSAKVLRKENVKASTTSSTLVRVPSAGWEDSGAADGELSPQAKELRKLPRFQNLDINGELQPASDGPEANLEVKRSTTPPCPSSSGKDVMRPRAGPSSAPLQSQQTALDPANVQELPNPAAPSDVSSERVAPQAASGSGGILVTSVSRHQPPSVANTVKASAPAQPPQVPSDAETAPRSVFPASEGLLVPGSLSFHRGVPEIDEEIVVRGTTRTGQSGSLSPSTSQGEREFRAADQPHAQRMSRSGHPHKVRPGKAGKTRTPKMRIPKEHSLDSRGLEMELDVLMPSRKLVPGGAPLRKVAEHATASRNTQADQNANEEKNNISMILGHGTFKDVLDEEEAQETLRSKTKAVSYSNRAMRERAALQRKPRVRDAINMWWHCAVQDAGRHPEVGVLRQDFVEMHRRIQKILMPQTNDLESEELALVEWQHASQGNTIMGHKLFSSSIFNLADLWCPDCSEESYVAFLKFTLEGIAETPPWPPEHWLPLSYVTPIQRNDGFLQAEFEALCAANGDLTSQTWNLFDSTAGFHKLVRKIASTVSQTLVGVADLPGGAVPELSTVTRPTPERSLRQAEAEGQWQGDLDAIFDEGAWRDKMKHAILSRRLQRVLNMPASESEREHDLSEACRIELRNYIDRAGDRNIRELGSGIKVNTDSPEMKRLKWQVMHQAQVAYLCIQALLHSKSEDSTQLLAHLKAILSDDGKEGLLAGRPFSNSAQYSAGYDPRLAFSDSEVSLLHAGMGTAQDSVFRDFLGPGDALTKASTGYHTIKGEGSASLNSGVPDDAMPTSLYKLFWVEVMERRERKWAHFSRT